MKTPVRLLPEASAEFDEAADWYERRREGLGIEFISHVREVFESISRNPQQHAKVYGDVRKAVVKKFPYVVLYKEDSSEILVIAVFHTSRDPAIWHVRSNE